MYLGPKHRARAIILTLFVFAVIIFVLLWVKFHTPIPPYPEGGGGPGMGLEVNLGSDVVASAPEQIQEEIKMPDFKTTPQTEAEPEEILSEENDEDAIANTKKIEKKTIIKEKTITTSPKEPITETKQPVLNERALFKSNKTVSTAQNGTDEKGNPNGSPGKSNYSGNGDGSGGGQGGGKGNGIGIGVGDGVSFSLAGRTPSHLEVPKDNSQSEGKVVVEITVDKNGSVINANPGVKGSTTLDDYLLQVAKNAALQSKFNRKPDATVQKGTITYRFVLQ